MLTDLAMSTPLLRGLIALTAFCAVSIDVAAQISKADYDRARSLQANSRDKVFSNRVDPNWNPSNHSFWYRVKRDVNRFEFVIVDTQTGTRSKAFDHARVAAELSKLLGQSIDARQLPFRTLRLADDESAFEFSVEGRTFRVNRESNAVTDAEGKGASDQTTVRRLKSIERSRNRGGDTSIEFVNRLDEPIQLIWIDASGARQPYQVLDAGASHEQHTFAGHVWLVSTIGDEPKTAVFRATRAAGVAVITPSVLAEQDRPEEEDPHRDAFPANATDSPDGRWTAWIATNNVFLAERKSDEGDSDVGAAIQLTTDGKSDDSYESILWASDSSKLVALQREAAQEHLVSFIESSPKDQLQPKLHQFQYLKPGDRIAHVRPRLFDVDTRQALPISDELFPNPWSISQLRWRGDSREFTFLYNERGHQTLRIVAIDSRSGVARSVVEDVSKTFIDYAGKQFTEYLDETQEIIWMSERDGWCHLYLYDANDGKQKNQITSGNWVVRSVEHIDTKNRVVYFLAGGVHPGQDPYYLQLCRVAFDGSNFRILTTDDGTHEIEFSPDREYFIDRWSRVDQPPVMQLRRSNDGELVCDLERADATPLYHSGWRPPTRFVAPGRDGKTPVYGVIYFPRNFDAAKVAEYPVIEKIYAGPHSSFVPKSFSSFHGAEPLAELGFVVVQVDGMGTSNRSKAFHDVCWKNLGDSGFPDRIAWLNAVGAKYPAVDLRRVGIYGGSAGGQSTLRALLAHGDFYRVGVADCGCHDNRMDKIWWNELWMGWPIGPHYEQQSNVTQAHRLQGKLLLTVGELDRNVDPASTMQVVNALIEADKDFDLIVFPGRGHGIGESEYGKRRRREFFVEHLMPSGTRGVKH